MTVTEIIALAMMMVTLAMMPSTSVVLVVTRSVMLGLPNGVAVAMGIVLGDLLFAGLALAGVTTLSAQMGQVFWVVKGVAAVYLLLLGLRLMLGRAQVEFKAQSVDAKPLNLKSQALGRSLLASFLAGLLVTLGDVKAIFFYASLFPTVVDGAGLGLMGRVTILLTVLVSVGGVKVAYAVIAPRVAAYFFAPQVAAHFQRWQRYLRVVGGSLMVAAGVYVMVGG